MDLIYSATRDADYPDDKDVIREEPIQATDVTTTTRKIVQSPNCNQTSDQTAESSPSHLDLTPKTVVDNRLLVNQEANNTQSTKDTVSEVIDDTDGTVKNVQKDDTVASNSASGNEINKDPDIAMLQTTFASEGSVEAYSKGENPERASTPKNLEAVNITSADSDKINVRLETTDKLVEESPEEKTGVSCTIGAISSLTENLPKVAEATPAKSALEIMASYASYMISPEVTLSQMQLETTPTKKNSNRYRPLAPKPVTSPIKPVPPIFSPRKSPRRQQLQRKAQAIRPKGLVVKAVVSPSKKAADIIVNKVLRRGNRTILPKPPYMQSTPLMLRTRSATRRQLELIRDETDDDNVETASEYDTGEGVLLDFIG